MQELYKRGFYINELLSQWQMLEPAVPQPLMDLLCIARARRGKHVPLTKSLVHTLCRSVSTVRHPDISPAHFVRITEKTSKAFAAQRTGTPLRNLRKFGEKWRSIVAHLGGPRPPKAPERLLEALRMFASRADIAFAQVRHEPGCPQTKNCHKHYGCRHNIINTSYLLKKGLLNFYKGDKGNANYRAHKVWFPQPNSTYRRRIRDRYWRPMAKLMGLKYWG